MPKLWVWLQRSGHTLGCCVLSQASGTGRGWWLGPAPRNEACSRSAEGKPALTCGMLAGGIIQRKGQRTEKQAQGAPRRAGSACASDCAATCEPEGSQVLERFPSPLTGGGSLPLRFSPLSSCPAAGVLWIHSALGLRAVPKCRGPLGGQEARVEQQATLVVPPSELWGGGRGRGSPCRAACRGCGVPWLPHTTPAGCCCLAPMRPARARGAGHPPQPPFPPPHQVPISL